jgi:hypothetical protein
MRASSAPIWRLKPTMSVNMMAARRRVSVLMEAIMERSSFARQVK